MADVTMDVLELTRITGVIDWVTVGTTHEVEDGDAGTTGIFYFPNDGRTFLLLYADGGAGETYTFTGYANKYGRVSADLDFALATAKTGIVGPFAPHLWNDVNGLVKMTLTTKHNSSKLLAVRITNSERNGV